ncbi:hypothetical protein PIB30_081145 [Stylosanthes scabra]|uniref:Uncharacterized protein n=1 Tax=Stylosanthes scabra TaxID=79078 RepID=A0ABU6STU7_9FABA|nr:hypothetical protein [Stylosanthes scabra]
MKCTVFGDMVGELVQLAARDDVQPLIVVAQLFKSSVYLNDTYIQNTHYMSQVFLNPDFPEVAAFRNRLYSAEDELEGGARAITTIEDVMNQTHKGKHVNLHPKVIQSFLEKKFLFKVSVSTQNVSSMDYVYAVEKICDDEALIGIYSSTNSMEIEGIDQSVSNMLPTTASAEADSQASGPRIVSLSKDTNSQGAFEDAGGSPEKAVGEDIIPSAGLSGLASPELSHSSTRSGRHVAA